MGQKVHRIELRVHMGWKEQMGNRSGSGEREERMGHRSDSGVLEERGGQRAGEVHKRRKVPWVRMVG